MAQLRTAPPRWLWHRGLRPCAPGHFGSLHKKPERFHIQTIMWLEVLQFRVHTWNIIWLEVPEFRFRIQNSVWLGTLKWRDSASAQRKYCGLEVTQFRFHTINLVRLEVSQFHFHTRALTLSPAVPPPHKEYSVTWNSAVSLPHKEYTMSRSSAILLSHTEQSVTQFRTIYCDVNFRSSASARKDIIWNSALLLLHENIIFLWKIHSNSTTNPFLNFRAVLHEWLTLWRTEKQRNRDAPDKSRR